MATEKELKAEQASRKRLEFLASCADQFMQDFINKAVANDTLGTIVASARLAQLGAVLCEEYEASCNALISSPTEKRVADQATESVLRMINDNADECRKILGETVEAAPKDASSN